MNLSKLINLCILLMLCISAGAQDRELEFKIVKLREASLYPDSLCVLKKDDTLRLTLRGGFSMADVASLRFDKGSANISDSQIIVIVRQASVRPSQPEVRLRGNRTGDTAALSSYMDTGIVQVHLNPMLHTPDTVLEKIIYILPAPPPAPTAPRVYRKTGFDVRWNKTRLKIDGYIHQNTRTRIVHHLPKEKLLKDMADDFRYQNYNGADTSIKKFDSMYAVIITPKKSYRFHMRGNQATPEMMDAIQLMHNGDKIRLRLFWNDEGEEKRVTTYFRISVISYNENGSI